MSRRIVLGLTTIALLCIGAIFSAGYAPAQQKTLKEQLVGTWMLVSSDNVAPDGIRRQIFGPNPKGMLILAADGNYAQVQLDPRRPKFKGKTRLDGTAEENKAVVAGTIASFGTWTADDASKTLTLRSVGSLYPNAEGSESRRPVMLAGDEFKASNPNPGSGGQTESVYRRAK